MRPAIELRGPFMLLLSKPLGVIETNCYVLGCEKTRKALIVDPGGDFDLIKKMVEKNNLSPQFIINTHGHIDHIGAVEELKKHYGIKFGINENEISVLDSAPTAALMFGLDTVEIPKIDFCLKDGSIIEAGEIELKVIETPGHTRGSVCFLGDGFLISGDTLFSGSIGRTDLPGGSYQEIKDSITKKILVLDDNTKVYPGHGDVTTIGAEKRSNPYIREFLEV